MLRLLQWDSSGVYTYKSIVNYLKQGNFICKSEENVPNIRTSYWDSIGVYIYKSIVNNLRQGKLHMSIISELPTMTIVSSWGVSADTPYSIGQPAVKHVPEGIGSPGKLIGWISWKKNINKVI